MTITALQPSIKLMGVQAALIAAVIASSFAMHVVAVALPVWAVLSPLSAIQALSVCVVLKYLNPTLATYNFFDSALFLATPLVAGLRFIPQLRREDLVWTLPVWAFGAAALGVSALVSHAPTVSVMKAVTFAWIVTAILVAFMRLTPEEHCESGRWLFSLVFVIVLASLALLVAPAIAYIPTTPFLRGVLRHSQALGCIVAPVAAALFTSWVLRDRWTHRDLLAPALTAMAVILLTRSRTAALAVILGMAIAVLLRRSDHLPAVQTNQGKRIALVSLGVGVVALIITLAGGPASSFIGEFVFKRGETNVADAFEASRGEGAAFHFRNFLAAPLTGHGFGVHANGEFPVGVTEIAGIPVSAPVEKGFLPTAILEETGLIGGAAFAYMIWVLACLRRRESQAPEYAILLACLLVNLGESVLPSPGGVGMFVWLMIGFCLRARAQDVTLWQEPDREIKVVPQSITPSNLLR